MPLAEFVCDFTCNKGYTQHRFLDMSCYEEVGIRVVDNDNTALEICQVLVTMSEKFHNVGPMPALIE